MSFSIRTGRARFAAVAATFPLCLTALAGCSDSGGGDGGDRSSAPADGGTRVSIDNFKFQPAGFTVAPGTRITVTNNDTTTHTMTATQGNAFDTGDIAAGKSATFTAPSRPGGYPYNCTIHPFMKGSLTVE